MIRDRALVSPRAIAYRHGLAALAIFTLLAGESLRYLLSWWGWGAIAVVVAVAATVELVRMRTALRTLPVMLWATLVLMALSVLWSAYPGASALGVLGTAATTAVAVYLAVALTGAELVDVLAGVTRAILAASLAFEFVVAAFVRAPVLPLWVDYSELERIPKAFYWSRELLFEGGRIQGIVGNANLLAMIALLALIAGVARVVAGRESRAVFAAWGILAVAILALTRSTTVLIAAAVVVVVTLAAWFARRGSRTRRIATAGSLVLGGGITATLAIVFREPLLDLAGRSSDLTHRLDIWATVADLAAQRPVAGWGWVSYWAPWVEPFDDLVVINGVTYLQAHNAWLDVFLQLGGIGLVVVGLFALTTLARAWAYALDGPPTDALFLLALLAAYLVQSLAESRLLTEFGWTVLVVVGIRTFINRWPRPGTSE